MILLLYSYVKNYFVNSRFNPANNPATDASNNSSPTFIINPPFIFSLTVFFIITFLAEYLFIINENSHLVK